MDTQFFSVRDRYGFDHDPHTHHVDLEDGEVEPGPEELGHLRHRWYALQRSAQDAFRLKFPELCLL